MSDTRESNLFDNSAGILKKDACIVLVKTEWNARIADEIEKGCREELEKLQVKDLVVITVPGAVEIPFAIQAFWDSCSKKQRPDAFIAAGCVIRGDTPHFDYVCQLVTNGVLQLNLTVPVPTIFSVLTVENERQANERLGGIHGHKGREAAVTAIKMIALNRKLRKAKD
jgi:6,7-dimethyl-8-ribityllumazine synthase